MSAKQTPERTPDLFVQAPWGTIAAWFSSAGLTRLVLDWPASASARSPGGGIQAEMLRQALETYFRGSAVAFDAIAVDLSAGTVFQQHAWREARKIPWGQTRTYGEMARRLSLPGAARAVGQAMGANPVPVVIPCHRVVSAAGLGGFTGGVRWKRRLLSLEGAETARGGAAP